MPLFTSMAHDGADGVGIFPEHPGKFADGIGNGKRQLIFVVRDHHVHAESLPFDHCNDPAHAAQQGAAARGTGVFEAAVDAGTGTTLLGQALQLAGGSGRRAVVRDAGAAAGVKFQILQGSSSLKFRVLFHWNRLVRQGIGRGKNPRWGASRSWGSKMASKRRAASRAVVSHGAFISVHPVQPAGHILPVTDAQGIGFPDTLLNALEALAFCPGTARPPGGVLRLQGFRHGFGLGQLLLFAFLADLLPGGYIVHEVTAAAAFVDQFHRFFLS